MSRQRVARELQGLLVQIDRLLIEAENLAKSSGLVEPSRFGGARAAIQLAAGDLDQKGLLDHSQGQEAPPA